MKDFKKKKKKMKDFYRQKGAGTRKLYQAKNWVGCGKVSFLQGRAGVYPADNFTNADQAIPA